MRQSREKNRLKLTRLSSIAMFKVKIMHHQLAACERSLKPFRGTRMLSIYIEHATKFVIRNSLETNAKHILQLTWQQPKMEFLLSNHLAAHVIERNLKVLLSHDVDAIDLEAESWTINVKIEHVLHVESAAQCRQSLKSFKLLLTQPLTVDSI